MSVAPIYKEYNLSELQDALTHIDTEKFPERVAEIEKYIEMRSQAGDIESQFALANSKNTKSS